MSQSAVSQAAKHEGLDIDQKTVSRFEGGRKDEDGNPIYENPTLEKIAAVSFGLGVQPWQLLIPEKVIHLPRTGRIPELLDAVNNLSEEGVKAVVKHAQFLATDPAYCSSAKGKHK